MEINSAIYQEDGTIDYPNFEGIFSGLYRLVVSFEDASHAERYFDLETHTEDPENPLTLSEVTNISLFPVPVSNHTFQVSVTAEENTTVLYTLLDLNGDILHTTSWSLESNVQRVEVLNIPENLPPHSQLVNTFSFPDGSTKSILTITN